MTEKVRIINPADGVAWNRFLRVLCVDRPAAVRVLLKTESLADYLNACVAHVVVYRAAMTKAGTSRQDAERKIMLTLLPAELQHATDAPPLTEIEAKAVRAFVATVPKSAVELEV